MTGRRQLADLRMGMLSARRQLSTREEFAGEIARVYDQGLESMIEVGRRLNEAKDRLAHGEYEAMVEEDLPFSVTAAYRLRRVAEFVDSGVLPKADLPGRYTLVFELASLSPEELELARTRGLVNAKVTRKQLLGFKEELRGTAALPAPTGGEELLLGDEAEGASAPPAPTREERREALDRALQPLFDPPPVREELPRLVAPQPPPPALPAVDGEALPPVRAEAPAPAAAQDGEPPVRQEEPDPNALVWAQQKELEELLVRRAAINHRIAELCASLGIDAPADDRPSEWQITT